MTVQYCSDLHLEFKENAEYLARNPIQPEGSILLLAGDVVPFAVMDKHNTFFDRVSDQFEMVYWIPGNHEYYHSDILKRSGSFCEKVRPNVVLINNEIIEHEQVRFIFSTMWTQISPPREREIRQGMSDFHVIRHGSSPFLPLHFNALHKESVDFLRVSLRQPWDGKTVVVTHHVPTFLNYPAKYKGDILSEAFAVELFDVIELCGADYWVYGHHHQSVPEFTIGTTGLINNQLGYVKYKEHLNFDVSRTIQV